MMKKIILGLFLLVCLTQLASATISNVNASYFINSTADSNGTSGVLYISRVDDVLNTIVKHNMSTAPSCIVISYASNITLAQGSFVGRNCTVNLALSAGVTYRIGVNYSVLGGHRSTSNNTAYLNPGFPMRSNNGNFTGGYFGSQVDTANLVNTLNSTIYNIEMIVTNSTAASNLIVTLNSPGDGGFVFGSSQVFNSSATVTTLNFTNATFYLWNQNSSIFNTTTSTVRGTSNSTTWNITNIPTGNYIWNALWCAANFSSTSCAFANNNYTFQKRPFQVVNLTYNTSAYETSRQSFIISVETISSILAVTGTLSYDGVSYIANSTCIGITCTLERSIDIPIITNSSTQQIKIFNWVINVYDGSSQIPFNNSFRNQTINRIYLEGCGVNANATVLNFTAYDEQNRTRINPFSFGATFNYWLGKGTTFRNQTFDDASTAERTVCISPANETFKIDAQIDYDDPSVNDTYTQRNYFFQNASITNTTQHIRLFLLLRTSSTSFIQRVIRTSQIPVGGALIAQQRYYPENDTYETVAISKTDGSGETVGFYEVEIPDYRHFITKDGELLKVTERGKVFPESVPYTLTFTIGENFTLPWQRFEGIDNVVSNLSYNNNTGMISYTWIDLSGTLSIANLTVESLRLNSTNSIFCTQTSILQAGTLSCNVTGQNGTFIARGYIGRSPQVLDQLITVVLNSIRDVVARPFLFLWILLIITAIGAAMFYPPVGIPLLVVLNIVGIVLGVTAVGWIFVWAIIAAGIWIIWETSR